MSKLSPAQVRSGLQSAPGWERRGAAITRTFQFGDFPTAIQFVRAVARLAEKAWHHPDIDIRWNKVTLTFTTHDQGGLTEKDFALARQCNALEKRPTRTRLPGAGAGRVSGAPPLGGVQSGKKRRRNPDQHA